MYQDESVNIAAGQSRPLKLALNLKNLTTAALRFRVKIGFNIGHKADNFSTNTPHHLELHPRSIEEPFKYTFLHPGGIVSYAILRAPSQRACESTKGPLPILLNLHGAGLEADSEQVRHQLDPLPDLRAWVLFPTGVTPWSGDDWRRSRLVPWLCERLTRGQTPGDSRTWKPPSRLYRQCLKL